MTAPTLAARVSVMVRLRHQLMTRYGWENAVAREVIALHTEGLPSSLKQTSGNPTEEGAERILALVARDNNPL